MRSHSYGQVCGSAFARAMLASANVDGESNVVDSPPEEQYRREMLALFRKDMRAEQDSWAHSNEDGWFYED